MEDLIIISQDGKKKYMKDVVVDEKEMGVKNIIRGEENIKKEERKKIIYNEMGWEVKKMQNIKIINGEDGEKI